MSFLNRRNSINLDNFVSTPRSISANELNFPNNPEYVLQAHSTSVGCVAVSASLDIVVSGGNSDGNFLIHNLRDGTHLTTIRHPRDCSIDKIVVNSHLPTVAVYSATKSTLYLYSLNGSLIATKNIESEATSPEDAQLTCMNLLQGGNFLITGGGKRISVRDWLTLSVIHQYKNSSNVCDIALDQEERVLFTSLDDGKLAVYYKTTGTKLV